MLYAAYGSNTPSQMSYRCPSAKYLGKSTLENYRLIFRYYATIEKAEGQRMEVMLYDVPEESMYLLDAYEGFPSLYRKERVEIDGEEVVVYIMNEDRTPYFTPDGNYLLGVMEGYRGCNISIEQVIEALDRTVRYMDKEV